MKTVLCYGDSNTWGWTPTGGVRMGPDTRWPGVLREELGDGYAVIEEALPGRTTVWDDPIEQHKNGKTYLPPCLDSHRPIDLVVIMLGTNDLKARFSVTAQDIANSAGLLVDVVRASMAGPGASAPQVLLIAPPLVSMTPEREESFPEADRRSALFGELFGNIAQARGCHFLDAASVVEVDPDDGVHIDESEHLKLGTVVAERIQNILGSPSGADDIA